MKKIKLLIIAIIIISICFESNKMKNIFINQNNLFAANTQAITTNVKKVIINKNTSTNIRVTTSPSNITASQFAWTSNNTRVATVDSFGKVTGKEVGTAIITVSLKNNPSVKDICTVEVRDSSNMITSISLDKKNISLTLGNTAKLNASIYPSNATNKTILWVSNNKKVVTVTNDGTIKGVGVGTATILVVSKNNFAIRDICKVNVTSNNSTTSNNNTNNNSNINVTNITISKTTLNIKKGTTGTLKATITPSNATNKNVEWNSSNSSVVAVNKYGTITALAAGTAIITATSSANKNIKATCTITVVDTEKNNNSINNSPITIKFSTTKLAAGKTAKMTVTINNKSSSDYLNPTVSVSLPSIITTSDKKTKKIKKLGIGKSMTITLKIKANKTLTLPNNQTFKTKKSDSTITSTLNNLVKQGNNSKQIAVSLKEIPAPTNNNYGEAMVNLLSDMNTYAKKINPKFAMITNGGYELYIPGKVINQSQVNKLTNAMDGMLIEDMYYGWDNKLNKATPNSEYQKMLSAVKTAQQKGLTTFNMEYCNKSSYINKVASKSNANKTIYYNAPTLNLNTLPTLAKNRINTNNCDTLSKVKNFAAILDPDKYSKKSSYLNAIKNSNYDLIFIDMYHDGNKLTKKNIASLKTKKKGGRRYICAYISIGEAEDYRFYWKKTYKNSPPTWMATENGDWEGNYKVLYWSEQWKKILYGQKNSYFDQILNLGFDGVYLDVIDAYEFFKDEYK